MADRSIEKQNKTKQSKTFSIKNTTRELEKLLNFSMNEKGNCFSQGRQYIIFSEL